MRLQLHLVRFGVIRIGVDVPERDTPLAQKVRHRFDHHRRPREVGLGDFEITPVGVDHFVQHPSAIGTRVLLRRRKHDDVMEVWMSRRQRIETRGRIDIAQLANAEIQTNRLRHAEMQRRFENRQHRRHPAAAGGEQYRAGMPVAQITRAARAVDADLVADREIIVNMIARQSIRRPSHVEFEHRIVWRVGNRVLAMNAGCERHLRVLSRREFERSAGFDRQTESLDVVCQLIMRRHPAFQRTERMHDAFGVINAADLDVAENLRATAEHDVPRALRGRQRARGVFELDDFAEYVDAFTRATVARIA